PQTLAARVLAQEHVIYPMALRLVASGAVRIEGNRVLAAPAPREAALIVPDATAPTKGIS
ncbi:MAG: phosphoribosylglycinamide formyltransferase, partial [Methylocystis sp.]